MTVELPSKASCPRRRPREEPGRPAHRAYGMEIETVMSYMAASINPDGVRAQEVNETPEKDVQEELGHAGRVAERFKELYGVVPGSEILHDEEGHRRLFEGFLRELEAEGFA